MPAVVVAPGVGRARGRRQPAEDERPEAVGVADPDEAALVEHDEAVGPADVRQDPQERLDRVGGRLVGQERREELRVGAGGEPAPTARQPLQELPRVHEVAVVPDRERAAGSQAERRLGVLPDRGAGRGVAAVGRSPGGRAGWEAALVEDLGDHPEVLVEHQLVAVRRPRSRPIPGPGAAGRRARGRPARAASPPGGTAPKMPHTVRPSTPSARGRPCSQAWRRSARARSTASATRAPRSSAAPVAPSPARSIDEPVAAGHAELDERDAVLGGEGHQRGDGARRRRPGSARDGLSPKRATAGAAGHRDPEPTAPAAPGGHLGEGDREPAPGDVLGGADEARPDGRPERTPGARPRARGRGRAARPRRPPPAPRRPTRRGPARSPADEHGRRRRRRRPARRARRRRRRARRRRSRASGRSRCRAIRCRARRCRR